MSENSFGRAANRSRFRVDRKQPLATAIGLVVALSLGACSVPGPEANREAIAALTRKTLAIEGTDYSVSYLEGGDLKGRLVVFVHGTPGEADGWGDYLLNVPSGFHHVALDRPGFGQSGPEDAVTSLSDQAHAVIALIRAQNNGPAILVGHSLGGPIVAQVAADAPESVAALVMLAASLDPGQEQVQWLQYVGDSWPVSAMLSRMMRNANRELIPLKAQLEALVPRLPAIKQPVVILHGTKDDLVPYANVAFMKSHMTGSAQMDVTTMDGQNHFVPWNAKPQVEAAIAKAIELVTAPGTGATVSAH